MLDLKISDMMDMQDALYEKNKENWDAPAPEKGRNQLLWMFEELGEVIAIIKKRGDNAIMNDVELKEKFITELSDVLMYYIDTLICYGISPNDISKAYRTKFEKNMNRDFPKEHSNFLSK